MSTPCSKYEPLIAEALFGELSDEDRQQLDRHLEQCNACAEELRTMQATLEFTAQRERPEPPPSFWRSYWPRLVRRMEREAARQPSFGERVAAWWRELTSVPPAMRWALQGALVVVLVVGGFWLGRQQSTAPSDELLVGAEESPSALSDLIPAGQSTGAQQGVAAPMLANIQDITYDVSNGTVEIRYNTMNDVVVRGTPNDPAIQQLLQAAMLNEQNPSARLNALQAVEKTRPKADTDLVQALTYLAQEEDDPNMRLRAVRALRSLHQDTPLTGETRDVLINILLSAQHSALRIEALQTLMNSAPSPTEAAPDYLYQVQNDSNGYVRYQARQALQEISTTPPSSSELF